MVIQSIQQHLGYGVVRAGHGSIVVNTQLRFISMVHCGDGVSFLVCVALSSQLKEVFSIPTCLVLCLL